MKSSHAGGQERSLQPENYIIGEFLFMKTATLHSVEQDTLRYSTITEFRLPKVEVLVLVDMWY